MTNRIHREETLVNELATDIADGVFTKAEQHELNRLVHVETKLAGALTRLEAKGLAQDAVFQQDLASLVTLEAKLVSLVQQTSGNS